MPGLSGRRGMKREEGTGENTGDIICRIPANPAKRTQSGQAAGVIGG